MKLQDYSLQPTGLKPSLQILLWKCTGGKGCSKILKTPKNLCKTVSSSLMLQACSLEFTASTNQTPRKKCSETARNSLRKDLQWRHFIKVTRLPFTMLMFINSYFMHLPFWQFQKNVFGKVLLSSSSCPIYHK